MRGNNIRGDEKAITGWLEAIIESADDAIMSKTLDGILTSWNKAAEHIFGYTADEAVGQPVLMLIPKELHNEEVMILSKIKRGERIEHFHTKRRAKDGRLIDVSLTVSPIKGPDGEIILLDPRRKHGLVQQGTTAAEHTYESTHSPVHDEDRQFMFLDFDVRRPDLRARFRGA